MLKFKLISKENGIYIYEYYPEGDFSKKPGVVSLDINTQEIKILVAAEEDTHFQWFGGHMLMYLECRLEDSNFEEEGMVAWY